MHSRSRAGLIWLISILLGPAGHAGQTETPETRKLWPRFTPASADRERRLVGIQREDATDTLQAAIRSGARKVIVAQFGQGLVVRRFPIGRRSGTRAEPGVVITAQRGAIPRWRR